MPHKLLRDPPQWLPSDWKAGLNLSVEVAQAVFHIDTQFGDCASVFFKNIFVEDLDGVAEDDRVRHFHHGGLHMQREQHATFFRRFNLLGQEAA